IAQVVLRDVQDVRDGVLDPIDPAHRGPTLVSHGGGQQRADLDDDEFGLGRHADIGAGVGLRVEAAPGSDGRDVRAVAVAIAVTYGHRATDVLKYRVDVDLSVLHTI